MGNEFYLPPELEALENELREVALPSARANRDEVLYRAGWAAAEAQASRGRARSIWPVTSGVLAAAVVILAGLLLLPSTAQREIADASAAVSPPAAPLPPKPGAPAVARWFSSAPLLALRERALREDFPEPQTLVSLTSNEAVTARDLMRQFLPESEQTESAPSLTIPSWLQPLMKRQSI